MDANCGRKIRPLEQFNICSQLKSIKLACTELATNEGWCKEKLNNIKRLHEAMCEMMKKHVSPPSGIMQGGHPDGEMEGLTVMRLLQLLIDQKCALEQKNQRLEEAVKAFREQFEKLL